LDHLYTGAVSSTPTRSMDICPRFFVLCCPVQEENCVGLIPRPRSAIKWIKKILRFRNWFWIGTSHRP
jgi:hypothetical protein